jgi:hypothetical protein
MAETAGGEQESERSSGNMLAGIVQLSFTAALASYLCNWITEPDFYFHLLVGRWIHAHHALPTTDIWTRLLLGHPWLDANWLFQYLLSAIEDCCGWTGLAVFKLLLSFVFVWLSAVVFSAAAADRFFGTCLAAIVSCGVLEPSFFGPELAAYSLFLCFLASAYAVRNGSAGRRAWIAGGFSAVLLANLHPSYLLVLAVALLTAVFHRGQRAFAFFLLTAVAALFNPYLGKQVLFEAGEIAAQAKYYLQTQSAVATVFDYSFSFLLLLWFLTTCIGAARSSVVRQGEEIFLAAVLSLLSLAVKSLLPFALLSTAFVSARLWAESLAAETPGQLALSFRELQGKLSKLPAPGSIWVLLCLVFVNSVNFIKQPNIDWFLPKHALDYLQEKHLEFPLWHESGIGPYVAYRLADQNGEPRELAAWDFRAVSVNQELLWNEKNNLWRESFSIFDPKTVLVRSHTPLYETLATNPRWRLVFQAGQEVKPEDAAEKAENPPFLAWALFVSSAEIEPHPAL